MPTSGEVCSGPKQAQSVPEQEPNRLVVGSRTVGHVADAWSLHCLFVSRPWDFAHLPAIDCCLKLLLGVLLGRLQQRWPTRESLHRLVLPLLRLAGGMALGAPRDETPVTDHATGRLESGEERMPHGIRSATCRVHIGFGVVFRASTMACLAGGTLVTRIAAGLARLFRSSMVPSPGRVSVAFWFGTCDVWIGGFSGQWLPVAFGALSLLPPHGRIFPLAEGQVGIGSAPIPMHHTGGTACGYDAQQRQRDDASGSPSTRCMGSHESSPDL